MSNDPRGERITSEFPAEWNDWRRAWSHWLEVGQYGRGQVRFLKRSKLRYVGGKNMLAEEVLGIFEDTRTGRLFELSEVYFLGSRGVGYTEMKRIPDGGNLVDIDRDAEGGVVHSFSELESIVFPEDEGN